MAQKRMFDRAIIEQDKFLNISLSAKAIYFLLGMEADDEGFVSPNRVLRLYGGEAGDLKNLIDTGLVIPFESGVVVITNWNENNYLDKNRIKQTKYLKERQQLLLTPQGKYEFNRCLTRGEESSIEYKIEDSNSSLKYLNEIPKEDIQEFIGKFKCDESNIRTKAHTLADYCASKGKRYKNYKAFLSNALRKDFGERPPREKIPIYDTSSGKAVITGYK